MLMIAFNSFFVDSVQNVNLNGHNCKNVKKMNKQNTKIFTHIIAIFIG